MRNLMLTSAAASLLLLAPQLAAAQSAGSDTSVRNPDSQTPITQALSPTGRTLDESNSVPAADATPNMSPSSRNDASMPAPTMTPAPMTPAPMMSAPMAASDASATVGVTMVTNGPVADTPENRAKYGAPMSNAGKRTAPTGN